MLRSLLSKLGFARPATQPPTHLHAYSPGDLLALPQPDGQFKVAKILVVDQMGVHIRVYRETFPVPPNGIGAANLTLGNPQESDGFNFNIGHMPITHGAFVSWNPIPLGNEPVDDTELDGYEVWLDSRGGYFR